MAITKLKTEKTLKPTSWRGRKKFESVNNCDKLAQFRFGRVARFFRFETSEKNRSGLEIVEVGDSWSERPFRRPEPGFSGNGSSQSARFLLRLFPGGLRRRRPQTVGSGHLLRAAWGSARRARPAHGCGTKWNGLLSSYAGKSPLLVLEGLKVVMALLIWLGHLVLLG